MSTPARAEQAVAWELRTAWAKHQRLEGTIEQVAVTGAFVVIDGWHVPCADVLGVAQPHFSQQAVASQATTSPRDADSRVPGLFAV